LVRVVEVPVRLVSTTGVLASMVTFSDTPATARANLMVTLAAAFTTTSRFELAKPWSSTPRV
jgi:hypothetical protein